MTTLVSLEPHVGCIAAAMNIVGTKWTALLLRDLATGPKRFGDFERSIPGINPRTLSRRLDELAAEGIVESCKLADSHAHCSYRLTQKGEDLIPVLRTMAAWGEKYSVAEK